MDMDARQRLQTWMKEVVTQMQTNYPNWNPQHFGGFRVENCVQFGFTRTIELRLDPFLLDGYNYIYGVENLLKIETEPFDVSSALYESIGHSWKLTYEEKEANEEDLLTVTLLSEPVQSMFVGFDFFMVSDGRLLGIQGYKPCFLKPNFSFSTSSLPPLRLILEQNVKKRGLKIIVAFRHFLLPEPEDKFQLNRLDTFGRMWNFKQMSDVSVKTDRKDEVLPVHKAVLGVWSPVFERMVRAEMKESFLCEINISDFSSESVKCFLRYLYGEDVQKVCRNNAEELLAMAEKYQVAELKSDCEDWLVGQVNTVSVCQLLVLADLNRAEKLEKACIDFVVQNRAAVVNLKAWRKLNKCHFSTYEKIVDAILGPKWESKG